MERSEDSVLELLGGARTEAEELKSKIENGEDAQELKSLWEELSARFQLINDEAQHALEEQFNAEGTLSGVKACDINSSIDNCALTIEELDRLMKQYGGENK